MNTDRGFESVSICVHLWISAVVVAEALTSELFSVSSVTLWWIAVAEGRYSPSKQRMTIGQWSMP